ncbi:UNVERIFIED_CONTAM: hypothetical protein K2H54_066570 [Gekko kuhli]
MRLCQPHWRAKKLIEPTFVPVVWIVQLDSYSGKKNVSDCGTASKQNSWETMDRQTQTAKVCFLGNEAQDD